MKSLNNTYFAAPAVAPSCPSPTMPNTQESESEPLKISVWQTYPHHAVLDWLITLAEKDTLVRCDMAYGATEDEDDKEDITTVENFLPSHRSIVVPHVSSNNSYWVCVSCRDGEGGWHHSKTLHFTTGKTGTRAVGIGRDDGITVRQCILQQVRHVPGLKGRGGRMASQ